MNYKVKLQLVDLHFVDKEAKIMSQTDRQRCFYFESAHRKWSCDLSALDTGSGLKRCCYSEGRSAASGAAPAAPGLNAEKVRSEVPSAPAAAARSSGTFLSLFGWISNISAESALFFGSVKRRIWFLRTFLFFVSAFSSFCWTPECVCGEQGAEGGLTKGF